ncbi:MAG: hypothetical protein J5820_05070, partial [Rhodocyclaceae bacterium]|nr:hypothetical protein [Rhodocyclaceae bacterium]
EKSIYNGEAIDNSNYLTFGHYTQMVWNTTTEIGCGYKVCSGAIQMVCNYNPPGNVCENGYYNFATDECSRYQTPY